MRCNKCGSDNPDDRLVCQLCGHKLQSGRSLGDEAGETGEAGASGESGRAAAGASDAAPGRAAARARRDAGTEAAHPESGPDDEPPRPSSRLLDFQGWASPLRGLGPYLEACLYAGALAVAVGVCLWTGVLWPLYPLLAVLGVVAWLRRL